MKNTFLCLSLLAVGSTFPAAAQSSVMETPRQSQRSSVSQRIELTDITVNYHRPLVKGRKVWDAMVPYGQVWRAGANENTTIEFSEPVMIEGQRLAKGVYGLHMLPTADTWTIIFSKSAGAWGSYTYDEKEDALRVTVKPVQAAESFDALTYEFDQLKPDSTVVTMHWEKLAVPFKVTTDKEATIANMRNQLRGRAKYTWDGWNDAATWCLDNKINLEEALRWTGESMAVEERFENIMLRSRILEALNRPGEVAKLHSRAMAIGNVIQVYTYGRQLQGEKKKAEAIEIYRVVAKRFSDEWIGKLAQVRVAVADGDFAGALKALEAASAAAPESQRPPLQTLRKRLENKEDINT